MGSAYDARIDGNSLPPANSFNHSLLQEPQQLDLKRQRNVAHFVQKQGAPIGLFDLALGRFDGAREGPFFMAEQLGFQQVFRDRRAVDREKLTLSSAAAVMDAAGQRSEEHTSELHSLMRISYAV